jgi:GT2 family glycosyltransferase
MKGDAIVFERRQAVEPSSKRAESAIQQRVRVAGKFLWAGDQKFWVKGVTYGTFRPSDHGEYPCRQVVEADFAAAAGNGINAVRTYTVPPRWLLDIAQRHGLCVMIGLAWEQHVTFLDDRRRVHDIVARVGAAIRICSGHPAVLCYSVGNEIPASIVRWFGRRRIERFIRRVYEVAKEEDPQALVTYVNFPTTEYLQLPFLDLVCFNVYLESQQDLSAYLARLQNLAGERPLLLTEIGLDSRRHGEVAQAKSVRTQLRNAFAEGCAGAFVFAWTDEWYRGGYDIEDWDFGLTDRSRRPKPAQATVRRAFAEAPFPASTPWPRISVVVCSFNGGRTIRDTLEALQRVDYPDYEVIVINDGSTDDTPRIAREFGVRLISTENRGLSSARNTGWQQATGEIVAYIDDDAYPDPHWLKYLAATFLTTSYVGVGGPNLAPADDGWIADCVANAPGGPVHVLVSDREAEHIPGCNMAFRREALEAVGGFDPRYRAAGDDVDICWRLQERGWTIGFSAAAMVWHHRRNSLRMYWKQQRGYGKAEALLEAKWPERYNTAGHLAWAGRLYGKGLAQPLSSRRWRIYHGPWGTAPFQSLYQAKPGTLASMTLMPDWYLVILGLAVLTGLGAFWRPLLISTAPLLVLAVAASVAQAISSAAHARFHPSGRSRLADVGKRIVTVILHLAQPGARLNGRLQHGLTPWRRRTNGGPTYVFWPRRLALWSECWRSPEAWAESLESALRAQDAIVRRGGEFDDWDFHVRGGLFGALRTVSAVEEHGAGKQLVRLRARPWLAGPVIAAIAGFAALAALAFADHAWTIGAGLAGSAGLFGALALRDCAVAAGSWVAAVRRITPAPASTRNEGVAGACSGHAFRDGGSANHA